MKTFVGHHFEVMEVDKFQTKANSYEGICSFSVWSYWSLQVSKKRNPDEDICWVSGWNYVTLWISNKIEFFWRHLFILSLKLFKLRVSKKKNPYEDICWDTGRSYVISFKSKQLLMKTFVEPRFEVL